MLIWTLTQNLTLKLSKVWIWIQLRIKKKEYRSDQGRNQNVSDPAHWGFNPTFTVPLMLRILRIRIMKPAQDEKYFFWFLVLDLAGFFLVLKIQFLYICWGIGSRKFFVCGWPQIRSWFLESDRNPFHIETGARNTVSKFFVVLQLFLSSYIGGGLPYCSIRHTAYNY